MESDVGSADVDSGNSKSISKERERERGKKSCLLASKSIFNLKHCIVMQIV